nr:Chain A, Endoglucanase [Acetivibrio cellulolyticus]
TGFNLSIDTVEGNPGSSVVVPVKLSGISKNGISTADFTVTYDATKLEYISGDAGSIVTNPGVNFGINKESDGKLKVLFLDYTMSTGYISTDGVFANLNFNIKSSAAIGSKAEVSISGTPTFGDSTLTPVVAKVTNGAVNLE